MCLSTVIRKITPDDYESSGVGYKIIRKKENTYLSDVWGDSITFKVWQHKREMLKVLGVSPSSSDTINSEDLMWRYKIGFHIYCNLQGAQNILRMYNDMRRACGINEQKYIVKVRYKNAHTLGKESGTNVIVADDIFYQEVLK